MTIQRLENGARFCRVLTHNGTVHLAGMTADDTRDVVQQPRHPGEDRALSAHGWHGQEQTAVGADLLRDIADFDRMNIEWDRWIDRSAMPVRATVEARLAGDAYRVEIMVTAAQ